jgi:hypothetical protein
MEMRCAGAETTVFRFRRGGLQFVVGHNDDGGIGIGAVAAGHGEAGLGQRGLGRLDFLRQIPRAFRAQYEGLQNGILGDATLAQSEMARAPSNLNSCDMYFLRDFLFN